MGDVSIVFKKRLQTSKHQIGDINIIGGYGSYSGILLLLFGHDVEDFIVDQII